MRVLIISCILFVTSFAQTACTLPKSYWGYNISHGSLEGCTAEDCSNPILSNVTCANGYVGTPQILKNGQHIITGELVTGACFNSTAGFSHPYASYSQWTDPTVIALFGCFEVGITGRTVSALYESSDCSGEPLLSEFDTLPPFDECVRDNSTSIIYECVSATEMRVTEFASSDCSGEELMNTNIVSGVCTTAVLGGVSRAAYRRRFDHLRDGLTYKIYRFGALGCDTYGSIESFEEVSLVMQVTGATEGNKHKICNSTANALSGSCSYVSLWAPSTGNLSSHIRRRLRSTSVYMDIAVADADAARTSMEADGFLASLQSMPAGVTVSSVTASTGDPDVPAYESIGYCCLGDDGYCAHDTGDKYPIEGTGDELGCLWSGAPIPGHDISTCAIACENVPGQECVGFDFLEKEGDGYWCCLYRTCGGELGESGRGYRLTSSAIPSLETDDSDESESAGSKTFGILFLFATIAVVLF